MTKAMGERNFRPRLMTGEWACARHAVAPVPSFNVAPEREDDG